MIMHHRGVAFESTVTRDGCTFVATASILGEGGQATSMGKLGVFANQDGALDFAVRCTTAFIDGDDLPVPPFRFASK
ncbi:hypothetical protein CR51_16355 [Caballeronia megalochromosomata]|nr:hypothetical protein CR51_16355 [Caballeronia megalochromosomata]